GMIGREAARHMVAAKIPGSIVNVASILALRQAGRVTAYATAKAGLVQMTKQLALEWARFGIRVNALAPGYVETDFNRDFFQTEKGREMIRRIPSRRLVPMHDLAEPLILLAGEGGASITGVVLPVDAGHFLSSRFGGERIASGGCGGGSLPPHNESGSFWLKRSGNHNYGGQLRFRSQLAADCTMRAAMGSAEEQACPRSIPSTAIASAAGSWSTCAG